MILTVTMNPAIDKTLELEQLVKGEVNRIRHVELDIGGKGINVSKAISELGGKSIATGFIAGNNGQMIRSELERMGIVTDFVEVEGETRTNTKVHEMKGGVTELNEQGPKVGTESMEKLLQKITGYVSEETLVVLAGSVPSGVDKDIYKKITEMVHEGGGRVFLDADGELFVHGMEAVPDMIKPNREELQKYIGTEQPLKEEEIKEFAEEMLRKGISEIAISMGSEGALFFGKEYQLKCPAVDVTVQSTVGAGDAMVAAVAYSREQNLDREEQIRYCMAVSAGAVTTAGTKPPARELVEKLKEEVEILYL